MLTQKITLKKNFIKHGLILYALSDINISKWKEIIKNPNHFIKNHLGHDLNDIVNVNDNVSVNDNDDNCISDSDNGNININDNHCDIGQLLYQHGHVRYKFNIKRKQIIFYFCDSNYKLYGIKPKEKLYQDHYYCCENFQSKLFPNVMVEKLIYRIFLNLHLHINNILYYLIVKYSLDQIKMTFIGHSFSGSLSSVMSLYYLRAYKIGIFNIKITVKNITYGSYRVGNKDFVDMYNSYFNYYPDCKNFHLNHINDLRYNYPINGYETLVTKNNPNVYFIGLNLENSNEYRKIKNIIRKIFFLNYDQNYHILTYVNTLISEIKVD
jgi:hypothetical protein